jgi:2-hydroxychromene-2-carboxylate isomerase
MNRHIDFYFDFISPYSYLAHKKIINLNQRNIFNYKAILLGGLHNLGEVIAPAFNEKKMKNMKNDCILISKKNKIPFKWNEKFPINSLHLMRGFLVIDDNKKNKFIDLCFDAYWKDNLDISIEKNIRKILSACEIEYDFFEEGIKEQKIKDKLKNLTSNAFNLDVFGAPTFLVNNKLFWGQDRLEYAIDELKN